jgi:S-DNA-T family DNA segregation ATPase FtsK/SpoIIIE
VSWRNGVVVDPDAGWQQITVDKRASGPSSLSEWAGWGFIKLAQIVTAVLAAAGSFVAMNAIVTLSVAPALVLWAAGLPWLALVAALLAIAAHGAWFWYAAESFDRRILSPLRRWWRRRRYVLRWTNLMVSAGLTVVNRKREELAPKLVRIRQGRFADVLRVKLPDGITAAMFAEKLPEITEALRARECRITAPPRRRLPQWIRSRMSDEFMRRDSRPGTVFLRMAYGDPLVRVVTAPPTSPADEVDLSAVRLGLRDDGKAWTVSLLGTHILLAGATGSGKGSVLWSLIAAIGPAIRSGMVQVVGLDPKGGMELGFGRELFRKLITMSGPEAEQDAVLFLEELAAEADRRAHMLAGRHRLLQPSPELPFLLVVIDELASVSVFISDSRLQKRADAALGRLLTKGRAPGMCVVGALQDPRKEVVRWRDLFPTRIALRLVEEGQVDLLLGPGARKRGARCDELSEASPGVGYVVEDGSKTVTRVRAAYLTDDDIRRVAQTYRPGPVLHSIEGGEAA